MNARLLSLLLLCAAGAAPVVAQSVPATSAASVYEFLAGPRSTLYAINEYPQISGHAFDSYVDFDLSALAGSAAASATLRLYTDAATAASFMTSFGVPVPAASSFTVTDASAAWFDAEGTPDASLSWASRPLSGGRFESEQAFEYRGEEDGYADYWIEVDVTTLVNQWLADPASNFGFRISALAIPGFSASAFSGSSAGEFAPQLVVTAVPEPGAAVLVLAALAFLAVRGGMISRRENGRGNRLPRPDRIER